MFIFPQTQRLSKYTINMQRKVIFLTCYALVEFLCKDWNIQCTVKLKIYCTTLNLLAWTFFYSTVKHTWSMRFGSLINQAFSWLCFWSAVLLLLTGSFIYRKHNCRVTNLWALETEFRLYLTLILQRISIC